MREHALPSPPNVLGVDGVLAGRVLGSLATHFGWVFARAAMEVLDDQYATIGVSAIYFRGLPDTYRRIAFSVGYR